MNGQDVTCVEKNAPLRCKLSWQMRTQQEYISEIVTNYILVFIFYQVRLELLFQLVSFNF